MHARARCPSKPEQTYGDEQSADDGDRHAFLWLQLTLAIILGLLDVIQVREEVDECANEGPEEEQVDELLAPAVDTEKDELEPDVQERVDEAGVNVERKGAHEDVDSEVARGHGCRGHLGGRHGRRIARGLA